MRRTLAVLVAAGAVALAGQSALAADLPAAPAYKAPPAAVVSAYNWTGLYAGIHAGYLWARVATTNPAVPAIGTAVANPDSFTVGGHIGWLYQTNNLVLGVEGDWSWLDGSDTGAFVGAVSGMIANSDWDASIRAILGLAMNRTLIYATGGWSWAHGSGCGIFLAAPATCIPLTSYATTVDGWTAGVGLAHAVTDALVFRVEYLYADYGTISVFGAGFVGGVANVDVTASKVRLGVSLKLNPR